LKTRIREARLRASLAVNAELIGRYWQTGRDILERQGRDGWGARVVDRLAVDLRAEFPGMRGFSRANLLYMRAFAEAWPDPAIVQRVVGQLPWGQNIELLTKLKEPAARLWYAEATLGFCQGSRPRHRNEQFRRYIRAVVQSESAMLRGAHAMKFQYSLRWRQT
jgi:predicted nuclease of restriction endonuclease-like (RecB) superfamily